MLEFCPKCGNLLIVKKRGGKPYLVCRKGHFEKLVKREKLEIKEVTREEKKGVIVLGKDEGIAEFPKIRIMCPRCGNMEAHWWMQQTRAADEPPTMFYRCTKCGYNWRSYG